MKRNDSSQVTSLEERLLRYADASKQRAMSLPEGEEREALLRKIQRSENAVRLCEWLTPSTSRPR